MTAKDVVAKYYEAFNQKDVKSFLNLLADDVFHDLNQGARQQGKAQFLKFMEEMNSCYDERVENLVVLTGNDPSRAAAEFTIHGKYLKAQTGLPPAHGQTYELPVGAFFEIENGLVKRITNYYNLNDWIHQVRGNA